MSNRTLLSSLIPEEFENHELRIRSLDGWPHFEEPLGEGGFGLVFKYATPLPDTPLVAGKHLKIENLFNLNDENKAELAENVQNFLREVDVLHQLKSSERILTIIGYYYDEEKLILFTELMTQGSIKDQIQQEPLSEQRALKYFLQTAEGLRVLHHHQGERIIHRDIKCANLLLTDADNVKVADFGLAFSLSVDSYSMTKSTSAPKAAEGTPLYAAPEVLVEDTYGRSADIWSLGCTLVEMLTCNPPHQETWCALEKDGNSEGAFESFLKLNAELEYSGNLVPTASEETRVLLDCLFTKDKNRRPKIDDICDVFSSPTNTGAQLVIDRERLFQLRARLSSEQ